MYNQEIKERYIETIQVETTRNTARQVLSKIKNAEEKLGMDVGQMDRKTSIACIQSVCTYDLSTVGGITTHLKNYGKWAYDNDIFIGSTYGIIGISPFDVNPQDYIRENIFVSESEMFTEMAKVVPIHDGYIESVAAVFAWIGVPEPLKVRKSDVFLSGRKIICNGIVVVDGFSDMVFDFLTEYSKIKESTRENGTTVYKVVADESYDTFIKRFCSPSSKRKIGTQLDIRTVQVAMSRMNERYLEIGGNPKFSYKNLLRSGALSRLYAAEKKGLNVFSKENEKVVEGFFYKTNYRNITWMYKHYKEAFNL